MKGQFWFYIIFYVCPYSITLVTTNRAMLIILLKICIIPQIVLLVIKLI